MSRFQTRSKMRKITGTKSPYCTDVYMFCFDFCCVCQGFVILISDSLFPFLHLMWLICLHVLLSSVLHLWNGFLFVIFFLFGLCLFSFIGFVVKVLFLFMVVIVFFPFPCAIVLAWWLLWFNSFYGKVFLNCFFVVIFFPNLWNDFVVC